LANTALDKYKNQEIFLYDDYHACVVKYNVYVLGKEKQGNFYRFEVQPK
jgi:hypothetical protein